MKKWLPLLLMICFYLPCSALIVENPPSFKYPAIADEVMQTTIDDKILIFAYGSLINPESAQRSISQEGLDTATPVVAYHLVRVFDYSGNSEAIDRAMLNVHATDNPSDIVNGVLYSLDKNDLEKLIYRENGYDLIPVIVEPWPQNPKGEFAIAYTFSAPKEPRGGKIYTASDIQPNPKYYTTVENGVKKYGSDFLNLWLETTYLSDGKTPVKYWTSLQN